MQGLVPVGSGTQSNPATAALVAASQAQYTDPRSNLWQTSLDWEGLGTATESQAPLAGATVISLNYRDVNGLPWLSADPLGHRYRSFFNGKGNPTEVVQPDDSTWQYNYNAFSEVTQSTDPLGHLATYTYNSQADLTKSQDALNDVTTYTYTPQGFLATEEDARGDTTSYAYDSLNRLTTVTNALGGVTTYAYDSAGRQTRVTNALGNATAYTYDAMNRVLTVTDALGHVTTNTYDPTGNLSATIDPLGHATSYAYDGLNRLTQTTDALGKISTVVYDLAGNVSVRVDPDGHRTSYAYDSMNRLTQTTDALNSIATTAYDLASNVIASTDYRGNTTSYGYDSLNRLVSVTDPLNHTVTTVYNADGDAIQTIDALLNVTTMGYDRLNRLITTQDPSGGITSTVYDAVGNVSATVDPLGHAVTYTYDQLNRQIQTQDARNGLTTTGYDAVGNVISIVDPIGQHTTMAYDALNRLTTMTDASNRSVTYAYDAASREVSTTDRDGRVINFSYDNDNRETGETWIVSGSTVNLLTFTYDAAGNEKTAANYAGTYTMGYDALNRMTSEQEPFGMTLTYTLDAVGNLQVLKDSLGGITSSAYDAANLLTSRTMGGTGQTPVRVDIGYTPRDQISSITRSSNTQGTQHVGSTAYTYDPDMRLTNITHEDANSNVLENFTYTYDLADRLTSQTINGTTTSYSYDVTNELTNDGANAYTYDLNGNRTMTGYQTGADNRLTNDGTWTYSYDGEGNLTKKSKGASAETWTYGYDNENHMVWAKDSATDGGTVLSLATYVYDVFGNRLEEDVWTPSSGTTVSRFAYMTLPSPLRGEGQGEGSSAGKGAQGGAGQGAEEIWADLNGSNGLETRYLHGDVVDQLFARVSAAGAVAWYLTDWDGSVTNLTDASGNLQDTITYDGYGNVTSESNPSVGDRFKYTGRELDSETGLQDNRARYYSATVGRWTSQDPLGFKAEDSNLYRYVQNAPTDATDPSGTQQTLTPYDPAYRLGSRTRKYYPPWPIPPRPPGFYPNMLGHVGPTCMPPNWGDLPVPKGSTPSGAGGAGMGMGSSPRGYPGPFSPETIGGPTIVPPRSYGVGGQPQPKPFPGLLIPFPKLAPGISGEVGSPLAPPGQGGRGKRNLSP